MSPVALKRCIQRTALAMLTPKLLAAELRDMPPLDHSLHSPHTKIVGKRHSRRLLCVPRSSGYAGVRSKRGQSNMDRATVADSIGNSRGKPPLADATDVGADVIDHRSAPWGSACRF